MPREMQKRQNTEAANMKNGDDLTFFRRITGVLTALSVIAGIYGISQTH